MLDDMVSFAEVVVKLHEQGIINKYEARRALTWHQYWADALRKPSQPAELTITAETPVTMFTNTGLRADGKE